MSNPTGDALNAADELPPEVQGDINEFQSALAERRMILNADQMTELKAPRARLERVFPGWACLCSIDGVLSGEKIIGALFAGECILVFAKNEREALDLATRGLRTTIELLREASATQPEPERSALILVEAGGRRAGLNGHEPLERNPELRAMLERAFATRPPFTSLRLPKGDEEPCRKSA